MTSKRRAWLTTDTTAAADFICRRLRIPNDVHLVGAVTGALLLLTEAKNWEQFGAASPDETAALFADMLQDYFESEGCMLGCVQPFIGSTPPNGALLCDLSVHLRIDYPEFYDFIAVEAPILVIDADSFYTPDFRDYSIIGAGPTFPHISFGGAWERTITIDQMPAHTHSADPHTHGEGIAVPAIINGGLEAPASAATPGAGTTGAATVTIQSAGGGEPFSVVPRYVAMNYIVWVR